MGENRFLKLFLKSASSSSSSGLKAKTCCFAQQCSKALKAMARKSKIKGLLRRFAMFYQKRRPTPPHWLVDPRLIWQENLNDLLVPVPPIPLEYHQQSGTCWESYGIRGHKSWPGHELTLTKWPLWPKRCGWEVVRDWSIVVLWRPHCPACSAFKKVGTISLCF